MDNPEWRFRLCNARLLNGEFDWDGWEFRASWARMLWENEKEVGLPKWDGKPCRLLILGEQGLGDEVMFASCLSEVNAAYQLMCDPRLVSVFERCFGIKCHPREIGNELAMVHSLKDNFDAYYGLGDLPRLYRRSRKDFPRTPYLRPDPARLEEMEPYRGRTGISWRGRNGGYRKEAFPDGLSLQYDPYWNEEIEPPHIDLKDDIEGILALISVLGKVRTVSTTVAHFAGALGVQTEVILAEDQNPLNQINWRFHEGRFKQCTWYGNMTVYRNLNEWKAYQK